MKIYFGVNEFDLVPGFDIPGPDADKVDEYINIQIMADEVDLGDFENVLADVDNLKSIRVYDEDNHTNTYWDGYSKVSILKKEFNVVYESGIDDNIELQPAVLDPQTGEEIHWLVQRLCFYPDSASL